MTRKELGVAPSGSTDTVTKGYLDGRLAGIGGSLAETRTATSATTLPLTSSSTAIQVLTGSYTNQIVTLPTTGVTQAMQWLIINESSGIVTVNASGGTTAIILASNTSAVFTAASAAPTTPTGWDIQYGGINMVSGKALTVLNTMSVASMDGAAFNFGNTPSVLTTSLAISTTQAVVLSYSIPANNLVAGMTFQFEAFGTQVTTGTVTYYVCLGSTGTTTDPVLASIALSNTTLFGCNFEGMVTIRSIGAGGTAIAAAQMLSGTSATAANSAVSSVTAPTTINTTGQLYLTIQCKTSAGTQTVQQAFIGALQV